MRVGARSGPGVAHFTLDVHSGSAIGTFANETLFYDAIEHFLATDGRFYRSDVVFDTSGGISSSKGDAVFTAIVLDDGQAQIDAMRSCRDNVEIGSLDSICYTVRESVL